MSYINRKPARKSGTNRSTQAEISNSFCLNFVGLVIGVFLTGFFGFAQGALAGNTQWLTFLAGTGAIVLTFLAGAELDPKWRESVVVGLAGFFGPFLGCTAAAYYVLHWAIMPSWLCGVAFPQHPWPSFRTGAFLMAAIYAVSSLILGLAAVWFGSVIAEII